jgi:predicted transcriptional regulator
MGCCFSSSDSSENPDASKETVYKYDNDGFTNPGGEKPIASVSDIANEYRKKELVIPNISVTLASPEIIDNGVPTENYPSGSGEQNSAFDFTDGDDCHHGNLNIDDYEEYPHYEPLRRMSADVRERKEKEAKEAARIKKENEAQILKAENDHAQLEANTKVQNDQQDNNLENNCGEQINVMDSIEPYQIGKRKRDDSDTSFNTVYHTATGPSDEIWNISEEEFPTETTVTVEIHSILRKGTSNKGLPKTTTIELPDEASRKFSQLAPAPKNNPLSHQVGQFSVTPTEGQSSSTSSPTSSKPGSITENILMVDDDAISRKFSQLAPAPSNSPHAIQVGGKFTMIPTEADHK